MQKTLTTDVLVCGGGSAGLAAALASARRGVRTLLVERAGFTGGIITAVGLPFFDGIADLHTHRFVVHGIAHELLTRFAGCPASARSLLDCAPDVRSTVHGFVRIPNLEQFKRVADDALVAEAPRLSVLYHSMACAVERDGDRIVAVLVANKDGLVRVRARVVVDATGDGDVAAWAGAAMEKTTPLMPMTLHFRIGNVRMHDGLELAARAATVRAHAAGALPMFYGPGFTCAFAPDEVYVHAVRVPGDASDAADLTRAEVQARRDAWALFETWKREVPGFEDAYYISSGPYTGVRETRRLCGRHVLTADDIRDGRRFADAVATGCWYLDVHPNETTPGAANREGTHLRPAPYDIPYGSLISDEVPNLLVAGRCHSATAEAASSTRVTVTAMALGEAAGGAAALAVRGNRAPTELDGAAVRAELSRLGGGPFTDA